MHFRQIYDPGLSQYTYLIGCEKTKKAILIDAERDVDRYLKILDGLGLTLEAVTETHIHADFLSGSRELSKRTAAKILLSALGEEDGWGYQWPRDRNSNVVFLRDGDTFKIGEIEVSACHTPGHTPEHLTFLILEPGAPRAMGAATGDFLFVGDLGRPDLLETAANIKETMEPAAKALYASAKAFIGQPDALQIWPAHGAGSACGKTLGNMPHSTMGYEKSVSPGLQLVSEGESPFVDYILEGQIEPPLYFARMKTLNKDGPPLLNRLPRPDRISAQELRHVQADDGVLFIDTRFDRAAVMHSHLPGMLYAPLNSMFCTVVGSLVQNTEAPIGLVVDEKNAEEATRRLVRIGFDNIVGFVAPETLHAYSESGGEMERIETIDFSEAERRRHSTAVVDVRSGPEYREAHIPDAIHAPYTRLPEYDEQIPSQSTLLVHCGSGARASAAAAYLARSGRKVVVVNDQFSNYSKVGHPVSEPA